MAQVDKAVYWAPWVTRTSINSATINWHGAVNAAGEKAGEIEYATTSYYDTHSHNFEKTVESRTTGAYQHVQLTGLEPDTSYTYWVKPSAEPAAFSPRTFRTMPASGPFTFIVMSDTHVQEQRFKYVADAIAKNETDVLFILDGGDYAGHDSEDLWAQYFDVADGMLAKFPIFTTIGNHEYHNDESPTKPTAADQYHWSFDIPKDGALNHYFVCAGIRFIILDSPDPATGEDPHTSLALARSQAAWLEGLLKDNMEGVFTIHHHPIWDYFDSTNNPDLQPWEDLYHAYDISANFAGHTHTYQRYSVNGIPYFIVGDAGGKFSDLVSENGTPVWYVKGITRNLGYLKVTVDPAKNTATAQEILVGSVETDLSADVTTYDPPVTYDTLTFLLRPTGGGGCFIATAAFGSPLAGQVQILRQFRDLYLMTNDFGRQFVSWYYRNGPEAANYIKDKPLLKAAVRVALYPLIGFSLILMNGILPYLILIFAGFILVLRLRSKKLSAA